MKGSPATWIRAFGTFKVCGRSRVASPPANKASAGILLDNSLRPFEVETDSNLFEADLAQGVAQALLVFRIE